MNKQTVWVKLWRWQNGRINGIASEKIDEQWCPLGTSYLGTFPLEFELPKRKVKKKISRWVVIAPDGVIWSTCVSEAYAEQCKVFHGLPSDSQIVELTGEYEVEE